MHLIALAVFQKVHHLFVVRHCYLQHFFGQEAFVLFSGLKQADGFYYFVSLSQQQPEFYKIIPN